MEIRKIGAKICLCLICIITFTGGLAVTVQAATSTAPLPLSQGGTGKTDFTKNEILITDNNSDLTTRNMVDVLASGSSSLLSSQGVYNYSNKHTLTTTNVITVNKNYFEIASNNPVSIMRIGNLMSITGPFRVTTLVPKSDLGTTVFTINSAYLPYDYISVDCSNNFLGTWGTAQLDCGYNASTVKVNTNENIPVTGPNSSGSGSDPRFVDISFMYLMK
ncbi:MAG: hypothetical protein LBT99_04545 [Bifidobacteriaceae bacterium]|jgi:hypothetical protein|nr:hypothetical protein [Bifidobacteriaceae bacterium]